MKPWKIKWLQKWKNQMNCDRCEDFIHYSTQYTAQSTQHTVHNTQHTVHSTQHTVHSTMNKVHDMHTLSLTIVMHLRYL